MLPAARCSSSRRRLLISAPDVAGSCLVDVCFGGFTEALKLCGVNPSASVRCSSSRLRLLWWLHGGAEAVRCKSFCFCAMQFIPSSPPHPCPRCYRQLPRGRPLWWLHGGAEAVRCKSFCFCAMQFIPSSPPYPCPRCCRQLPRGRHGYTGTGTISYCTMRAGLRTILL
jgi:hypothetical protein